MKKQLLVMGVIGILSTGLLLGCGGDKGKSPEAFGKAYVTEKFKGAIVDLDDLEYTVIEDEAGNARVKIEGEIAFEETISLVKQDGKWVLASKAAAPETSPAEQPAEAPKAVVEAPGEKTGH